MKLATDYINSAPNSAKMLSFGRISAVNIEKLKYFSKCQMGNLIQNLSSKAGTEVIQTVGDGAKILRPKNGVLTQLKELPLDIGLYFSKKLNIQSNTLSNYAEKKSKKTYQIAANGFYEYAEQFCKKAGVSLSNICNENGCAKDAGACKKVAGQFYKLLNDDMHVGNSSYNTRDERTLVRFFTGLVASLFIFNDFHNNSVRDGKEGKNTDKEATEKFAQEMKETTGETVAQFLTLGAFSRFTNNSTFAAPILNTLTSLALRVTSRLSSKKPLTKIKIKDKPQVNIPTVNEFMEAAKENKDIPVYEQNKKPKEKKKHLLTLKNILIACGISIGGGFALRYSLPKIKKTGIYQNLADNIKNNATIKNLSQKYHNSILGTHTADKATLDEFSALLEKSGNKNLKEYYIEPLEKELAKSKNGLVEIGEYEKMTRIPLTKIQVSKRELYQGLLTPFRIVKEIATYPYKLAAKALEGLKIIKKVDQKHFKPADNHNFVNIYNDFLVQKEKFKGKPEQEFVEHYKKHVEKHWLSALNRQTRSNVDNADIGKLTQILGTATSIYFATTDDFNRTARETGDKELAGKDARKRGLNKFFRIISQASLIDFFNHSMKVSYGKSLFGATAISAACTVATECVSHFLSGMPVTRLKTKEDYNEYQQKHKNGVLKGYYNAIDKLTD